jgi:hypothetical protein
VSAEPVAAAAGRLAAAVAWLSETRWGDDVARLAGARGPAQPAGAPPTYGDVARDGTAVVEGLARAGHWHEAVAQARHLRAFFSREGRHLGPIAAPTFDGLLAAALARDADEVADFTALIRELFP